MKYLATALLLISCSSVEPKEPTERAGIDLVRDKILSLVNEVPDQEDKNFWVSKGCDGMLWEGKLRAAIDGGNINAAERESGRFGRRPDKCYIEGRKSQESASTWSRDMAVGLLYWAWRSENLDVLERHAYYGKTHKWKMGLGAKSRIYYTPNIIGLLYRSIYALGGEDNKSRFIPMTMPKGLDDYEAHLQVTMIALQGELREAISKIDESDVYTGIDKKQFELLESHVEREPENVFFNAVLSKYTGDFEKASELCLSESVSSYVRCDDERSCVLSEVLFSCDFIARQF